MALQRAEQQMRQQPDPAVRIFHGTEEQTTGYLLPQVPFPPVFH